MLDSADMGRPKQYELPANMTFDRSSGLFIVRNPLAGKKRKFSDEAAARRAAAAVNKLLEIERQRRALAEGRPTIAGLCAKWLDEKLQFMPWKEGTRGNVVAKVNRISRELGARTIAHTDCMYLEEWITSFAKTADTFNDWRYVLVLLWRFAVSRKLTDTNEPDKIEERSTSKVLEANQKQRQPLDVAGFKAVHEKAEAWLQLAMELSLVTLLARNEICNMQHAHFRSGHLFVIRDKSSAESDMAFIKIAITDQLDELRRRSFKLEASEAENVVQFRLPYVIHRRPDSMRREWIDPKPHWSYITPDYLTKAFAAARDQVERFAALDARERPTFHEVRGLGSRIYEAQGMSKAAITALMTHADKRATEIYLDGGAQALTDDDYHAVVAPLVLRDVL